MQSAAEISTSLTQISDQKASLATRDNNRVAEGSAAASAFYELFSGSLIKSFEKSGFMSTATDSGVEHSETPFRKESIDGSKGEIDSTGKEGLEFKKVNPKDEKARAGEARPQEPDRDARNESRKVNETQPAVKEKFTVPPSKENRETENHSESRILKSGSATINKVIEKKDLQPKPQSMDAEKEVALVARKTVAGVQQKSIGKGLFSERSIQPKQATPVSEEFDLLKTTRTKAEKTADSSMTDKLNVSKAISKSVQSAPPRVEIDDMPKASAPKVETSEVKVKPSSVEMQKAENNAGNKNEGSSNQTGSQNSTAGKESSDSNIRQVSQPARNFSSAMSAAKGNVAAKPVSSNAQSQGSQNVALSTASSSYSKAAASITNAGKVKAPVQSQPPQVINQVIKAARISIMAGKEEMKILLKPEQLGWLKVKISVEGQRVVAHFSAENEFVRSLLESNMNQLQQALQNQNLKVTQISIDVADQNSGQQASQPHGHDQRGKANPALDGDHIEEAILAAELEAIQLTAVDMRV